MPKANAMKFVITINKVDNNWFTNKTDDVVRIEVPL